MFRSSIVKSTEESNQDITMAIVLKIKSATMHLRH